MTSAILTSLDEPSWGKSAAGLMRKSSHSNNFNTNPKLHSIPNKKTQNFPLLQDFPSLTQTSDDAHSFSQRPSDSDDFECGGKLTYNISSYTRIELIDLKRKLTAELEQIQTLKDRVDAGDFQSQRPPHQLAAKDRNGSGKKRPLPFVSEKNSSRPPPAVVPASSRLNAKEINDIMMVCRRFLTTLLKQKRCWVFKKPVDAAALGLHDYHQIVKHPMDLGTVKVKLYNSSYKTPLDFAADVRLTFNNAILYNPRTDDVHRWAVELLDRFEELFKPVEERLMGPSRTEKQPQLRQNSWNHIPTPEIDRSNKPRSNGNAGNAIPHIELPPVLPSSKNPPPSVPPPSRTTMRQPKPSARDPNKREMSMEEKQKLGVGLESLPQEKMAQLMHIMKKRNQHLVQEGDEIELDFSSLDTETLWELDRFVTNCKKMMSKTRREALMGNPSNQADDPTSSASPSDEENVDDTVKKAKKWEVGEEDVDIGDDDMPMNTFPPLEIEKDEGSSSDTSSSSSSSDSEDSRSSSGSDSDAQSRGEAT
ncbi:transcription factor GTE7-like [Impatiens glandulifera]|uniref:transcription factor GTE7-like n=1 Tax=Impatiens glandulifera TaxID=253017 RepID=UPI001FB0B4C6|nr:transcription factor GTE7-like [Impatiens glandulifera]